VPADPDVIRRGRDLDTLISRALAEDIGEADYTTVWTVPEDATGVADVIARQSGVVAGLEVARGVFASLDSTLFVNSLRSAGQEVVPGDVVLTVEGSLRSILTAERVALNFLAHLSGVASMTARFVRAVAGTGCRITDTRKTIPGMRALEKEAVAAAGGLNHRERLDAMVLIKENHIRAAGGVTEALRAVRESATRRNLKIEVEVTTIDELEKALEEGPDRVMLDNMTPGQLREAVAVARSRPHPHPVLEASGGVRIETVREIAATGVDEISVGRITHSAPALDLSLLVRDP
jgi:nicotinate-nucleotide pyrophosphorylase (carboxylating)